MWQLRASALSKSHPVRSPKVFVRIISGEAHSACLRGLNVFYDHFVIDDSESKHRRVLEIVVDEIDFQMVEETAKRVHAVFNRDWGCAILNELQSSIGVGAVDSE